MNANEFAHGLISQFVNRPPGTMSVYWPLTNDKNEYCQISVGTVRLLNMYPYPSRSDSDTIKVGMFLRGRPRKPIICSDLLEALAAVQKLHDQFRNGEI